MQIPFPITTFQFTNGTPVSLGTVQVKLPIDVYSPIGLICSREVVSLVLDINGTITGSSVFWQNVDLFPGFTVYIYNVYDQIGRLVAGPLSIIL